SRLDHGGSLECTLVPPDGPHHASKFIGERDGGLVVPAKPFHPQGPGAEPIRWSVSLCSPEHGSGPVGEEHSHIDVASLADGAKPAATAARSLAGGETEIAGEVPGRREPVDVAPKGHERSRAQPPDARDRTQARDDHDLTTQRVQLPLDTIDALFEV